MGRDDHTAAWRDLAASYGLALKALGIPVSPLSGAAEAEVTEGLTRLVSSMLVMALTDLYLIDAKQRGVAVSNTLIEQFASEFPALLEQQILSGSGTSVEAMLKTLTQMNRNS